jgi:hypothetical protein
MDSFFSRPARFERAGCAFPRIRPPPEHDLLVPARIGYRASIPPKAVLKGEAVGVECWRSESSPEEREEQGVRGALGRATHSWLPTSVARHTFHCGDSVPKVFCGCQRTGKSGNRSFPHFPLLSGTLLALIFVSEESPCLNRREVILRAKPKPSRVFFENPSDRKWKK